MTRAGAVREAVVLPAIFLTVTLLGGWNPGAAWAWTPPSLFALVLAVLLFGALLRSGALAPEYLLHQSRSHLENANGLVVVLSLFSASAQVLNMLMPQSGVPSLLVGTVLLLLLINTLAIGPDRDRLLRSLAISLGAAFVLKFVVLAALADPDGGRTRRVLIALFDVATLGTISQPRLHPAAGYVAFLLLLVYLGGIAALPARRLPGLLLDEGDALTVRP